MIDKLAGENSGELDSKQELLTHVLLKEGIQSRQQKQILPRKTSDNPPLSSAQQRLWFLNQLEPHNVVYNISKAYDLTGSLHVPAVEWSLNEIVGRHEILRTTFPSRDGQAVQVIASDVRLPLVRHDLRRLPDTKRHSEVRRLIVEEARKSFDLASWPLLRVTLLVLGAEEHVLIITVNQIIWDGWSFGVFYRELEGLYGSYCNGRLEVSVLPNLVVQYADFGIWQNLSIQDQQLEPQCSYWKEKLGSDLPSAQLPTDHLRPAVQTYRGSRLSVQFSESTTFRLKKLGQGEGVTLFMTLLAIFKTVLYRYTGEEDLAVGCPVSNRHVPEIDNLIGPFVNTLVLRTDVSRNPSFRELLSRVRRVCLGAYAHQDLPFEKVVEALQPSRDLSRNPIFQVMFIFQISPDAGFNLAGVKSTLLVLDSGTSKFDVTLSIAERDQGLTGFFEYSTDLFEHSTIQRMAGHFQTLLDAVLVDPDQPICTLPLLTLQERHQLLVEWNDTETDYPKKSCIHELFASQVERTSEAIAVESEAKQLSYRELNGSANQLAQHLCELGIGPGKLVGICVERSLEMVIGLLGILKVGGAYVPFDPAYPRERLEYMLEDSGVSVLLTEEKLLSAQLSTLNTRYSQVTPTIVCLDRDWKTIGQRSTANPRSQVESASLAYVIYTSGSTGTPKGVQVYHRSVVNCLYSIRERVGFTAKDVFLAATTISFDIAALELFLPLMTGAKVVLASRDDALDGSRMADRLKECKVTAMQATPPGWRLLLNAGWRGSESFKILSGGEALSRELADQLLEHGAALWNLYGPTETTIWSTIAKIEPGESPVLIGRPIANTQAYILDSHLQLVPIGVHGELYIGGDALARGYLNRAELTAERFVPNPFSHQPGPRLYRTGDRARYLPNGSIEFLGRVDNQVKVRGYRVEPGEIEFTLNQHPAVQESVVVARDDVTDEPCASDNLKSKTCTEHSRSIENPKSDKKLVAYVVWDKQQPTVGELRNFLNEKLPEHMVPSTFMMLEALPLNSNGKVDRKALPPPDGTRPWLSEGFVEPRTEIEALVAQIWREILKLDKVGVYDNFFELGGHSISAVRVASSLRNAFKIELSLPKIFERPTVAGLARTVEKSLQEHQNTKIAPIVAVERKGQILPSIAQEPILMLDKLFSGIPQFNILVAYRLVGPLDVIAFEWSVNEVIHRHEALRTTFPIVGGQQIQFIESSLSTKLDLTDLQQVPELERKPKAMELAAGEQQIRFDLERGPLFRVRLLRLSDDDHILLVTLHHVISDGWSLVLFLRDLAAFYGCCLAGSPSPLPNLPIQYADFAQWQQRTLRENSMETQLGYWKQQLSEPLLPLEFSTGPARGHELSLFTARKPLSIAGELYESLIRRSREENSTPFMILVTALSILVHHLTGEKDIRVGTLVANRNRSETENVIGHFVNTVILRTRLSPDLSFRDLVKRVRDVTLAAHAHQDLPFEAVVRSLENERNLTRSSICQVMFIYQAAPFHAFKLEGLKVSSLDENRDSGAPEMMLTSFDLIFLLKERAGELFGFIMYKIDAFDEATINQIISYLQKILERITRNPDLSVSEIAAPR